MLRSRLKPKLSPKFPFTCKTRHRLQTCALADSKFACFTHSVSRLWRNCARRVLRTQQHVAFVSASGASDSDSHVLCTGLAEEVEVNQLQLSTHLKSKSVSSGFVFKFHGHSLDMTDVMSWFLSLRKCKFCFNEPHYFCIAFQKGCLGWKDVTKLCKTKVKGLKNRTELSHDIKSVK